MDFLEVDYELAGLDPEEVEVRLKTEVVEVDDNPFCRDVEDEKGVKHYCLDIYAEIRYLYEEDLTGWARPLSHTYAGDSDIEADSILPCFWSGYKKPSVQRMFEHMERECSTALYATYYPDRHGSWYRGLMGVSAEEVYVFLKLRKQNYEKTVDFVRDYDYWENRMWNNLKWFYYLMGNIKSKTHYDRFRYPVGAKLLEWISPNDYPKEVLEIRQSMQ